MAALSDTGIEDISRHFLLCRTSGDQDGQTWSMLRKGSVVRSRMDCIISKYCRLFQNVSIWYPRHNADHYMVLGRLHNAT